MLDILIKSFNTKFVFIDCSIWWYIFKLNPKQPSFSATVNICNIGFWSPKLLIKYNIAISLFPK